MSFDPKPAGKDVMYKNSESVLSISSKIFPDVSLQ